MTVLGIETSCDETSAAVLKDGTLLSNVISSQVFHAAYGGVVPELASRAHQRLIVPIVNEAIEKAGCRKEDLDAVAAVYGPGLIGSLLVGLSFGKAFAVGLGIPFVGVNHMEAHVVSNLIEEPKPGFPYLNLTVSGGHTQLVLVNGPIDYRVLGETLDDAAGEAFDKVAKMLGLGYPGGPAVDRMARGGDSEFIRFPRPYLEERSFDFSFSGLKTSVLYALRRIDFEKKREELKEEQPESYRKLLSDFCASFQTCVVEVLVEKTFRAAKAKNVRSVAVAGGVGANSELRRKMRERAESEKINLFFPRMEFCTDNGAMVAMSGYLKLKAGQRSDIELAAEPNLELARSSSS